MIWLVDDRLRIDRRAEIEASGRYAADDTGFSGQRQQVRDLLLVGDVGDTLRHTDTEIDDTINVQLERRTAGDDFSFAHFH